MSDPIDFSQMAGLMPGLNDLPQKMENLKKRLGTELVRAESGGGMVTVHATANMRITKIDFDKNLMAMDDPEMIADLTAAAVNLVLDRCKERTQELTMQELGPLGSMLQNSPLSL